jgi:phage repressor protein C with HTH and peptisase S24 domain
MKVNAPCIIMSCYTNEFHGRCIKVQQYERLKKARIEAGFKSGTEAAAAMGVSVATYNAHENGHRGLTVRSAEKYADRFSVRTSWLLTEEEPMRYAANEEESEAWEKQRIADTAHVAWGTYIPGTPLPGGTPSTLPEISMWGPAEGDEFAFDVVAEWSVPADFITQELKGATRNLFLVKAPDDAIGRSVPSGDRAIVDAAQNSFRGDGVYLLRDRDGQLHLRKLTKRIVNISPEGNIGVSTDNPAEVYFTTAADLTIVGKVIGKIGSL